MEHINAPYNFVPLSNTVVTPEWGRLVSHDLPFKDGISGELELTIEALAPIMVGGKQTQGSEKEAGKVHFFQTPDRRYAIPGSSLRGAIRNVLEIATFSRMNRIDDKRFGLRDITGSHVADSYTGRVRDNVQYGFLHLNKQGRPSITPCSMVRLGQRDLEKWWRIPPPVFATRTSAKQKYELWQSLCRNKGVTDPYSLKFMHDAGEVQGINTGTEVGFPVFTGQISAEDPKNPKFGTKYKGRPKNKDFIFYAPRKQDTFVLSNQTWRDFLFIHGDEDGKPEMSWPGFWRKRFWDNQKVPVFYIQNKDRVQVGLAYMPKLAGDFSTHDMLKHTDDGHVDNAKPDFAELLFGRVAEKPEDALKGRVFFEPAFLQGDAEVDNTPKATILNGAKPSYFPNYIYQTTDKSGERLASGQYATYVHSTSNPAPELRGWKRYPVRPESEVKPQTLTQEQLKNRKVQTRLHTLRKGSTFKSRLVFHNLKPQELGALLWVLKFEGKRHSIGMAKSFGFGQVDIKFDWGKSCIKCNDWKQRPHTEADNYIANFQQYMTKELGENWYTSTPVSALLAMADPACRDQFTGELKHMTLDMKQKVNEFTSAKKAGLTLAVYCKDERTLKKRSHVVVAPTNAATSMTGNYADIEISKIENVVWENAKISLNPGAGQLTATGEQGEGTASSSRNAPPNQEQKDSGSLTYEELAVALSKKEKKMAQKNQLVKSVMVDGKGNSIKIIGWA